MRSIGMDVHQKQTVFEVREASGEVVERGKISTETEALQAIARRHGKEGVQVAIEASTPAFWIRDALMEVGARVEVTNPYKLRLIAESRSKTDMNDAAILAELLRCGGLPKAVYVPAAEIRDLREQLALRRQLIRIRTQLINRAKATYRRRGKRYSARAFHTDASWQNGQQDVSILSSLYQLWKDIEEQRQCIESGLASHWNHDATIQRLRTIPGIGPIVAYTIVAAVGEISRFKSAEKLASYAGLVPSERSSGESIVRGGITHQGRSELCGAMVQAAWAVLRTRREDTERLKKPFYKIMFKRNSQVAIVAVARKLLTIVYQVWKQETVFNGDRVGRNMITRPMASEIDRGTVACSTHRVTA